MIVFVLSGLSEQRDRSVFWMVFVISKELPITWSKSSGIFVQWVSGAELHFIINTPPEVELSSTSIFYTPNKTIFH